MRFVKPSFDIITNIDEEIILKNIERAGRTCYKSEERITETSARSFVSGIVKSGHHSVIEHEGFSVRFICDRGVTHEMVRHRLCAFSQESTRYVLYKDKIEFIIPPWTNIDPEKTIGENLNNNKNDKATCKWIEAMMDASYHYKYLINKGWKAQQARSVLPNSLKTEIVMTCNVREWLHVFNLRCAKAAHPQMREIMLLLLKEVHERIPVIFDDVYEKYKGEC